MAYDLRDRRQLRQGRLVHRGLPGGLHPPQAGRARLRDGRAALHRPRRMHRLRRLRRGVPGRRDLPGLRYAREVRLRARPQRASSSPSAAPPSAPPRDAARRASPSSARGRPGRSPQRSLRRAAGAAEIDFFERLPTPWGLLRGGVAPDHQEIKRLEDTFDRQTLARGVRFLGNVDVGVDVSHAELMRHYTAVVYATGAQTDKSLGIPGEELPGSWAATEFVGLVQRPPRLPRPRVRPLGRARRRHRQRQRRRRRHPHPHARRSTSSSAPTSPTTRSRRCARAGSARSSCSAAAARRRPPSPAPSCASSAAWTASTSSSDPPRCSSTRFPREWLDGGGHVHRAQERRAAARVRRPRAVAGRPAARSTLRFLRSPVAIRGHRPRRGDRDPPQRDRARRRRHAARPAGRRAGRDDRVRPRPALGRLPRRAAARRARSTSATSSCPTSAAASSTPTARRSRASTPSAGSSAAPPGSWGRTSATPRRPWPRLVEDLATAPCPSREQPGREAIDALLAEREPDLVTVEGWRADRRATSARRRASDRPRVEARDARRAARARAERLTATL